MRTKTSDFLNVDTMKPEYSFEFFDGRKREGKWRYPVMAGRLEPMRWATPAERDTAQAIFRGRKTAERAYAELAASTARPIGAAA